MAIADHPLYMTWASMRGRCNTKSKGGYHRYGGRGIKVCERWNVFAHFVEDMGERPEGMSLDRIDPNGNYEPSNCRWATRTVQAANVSGARFYSLGDQRHHRSEWERRLSLASGALTHRLRKGWSLERALSTPKIVRGGTK